MAVDYESRYALVGVGGAAKGSSNNVMVVNTRTNAIARTISLPAPPWGIAVHPSRHRAYVTVGYGKNGEVSAIDRPPGTS